MIQIVCGAAYEPLRQTVLQELRGEIERANTAGREPGFLYLCATPLVVEAVSLDLLAGLPGWQGQPVTLFGSLATRILDGTDVPALIPAHARLPLLEVVLEQQAAAGKLESFGKLVTAPGFVHGVAGLIAELKQASVRPAALRQALADGARHGPRDRELVDLYDAYQQALAQAEWIDPDDLLLLALSHLAATDGAFLRRFDRLVVEGFHQFTPAQEAFLQVAAACVPAVTVLLPLDPDMPGPFALSQTAAERLQALGGADAEIVGADIAPLPAAPALQHLATNWRRAAEPVPGDGIAWLAAATAEDERSVTVRRLRHLLRNEPEWRPSDVMIVWREGAADAAAWQQALAEAGIPCQAVAGDPLTAVPAVRAALLALRLASRPHVPARELVELLKTGYAGALDWRDVAAVEQAVLRIGGHVSVNEWLQRARARRQACWRRLERAGAAGADGPSRHDADAPPIHGAELDRLRREAALLGQAERVLGEMAGLLRGLSAEAPPAELAAQVRALWQALGLHDRAFAALETPDLSADEAVAFAARDLAGLERLDQLLREVVAGYEAGFADGTGPGTEGTERVASGRLVQGLLLAAQADRLPPAGGDPAGVRLCPAPVAAAAEPARLVIVTGLNDGAFPKRHRPDWLLREASRLALREQGVRLETGRERQAGEEFYFYQVITRATERLWLTWSATEGGEPALPSPFVDDVLGLFAPDTVGELRYGPLAPRPLDVLALGWADGAAGEGASADDASDDGGPGHRETAGIARQIRALARTAGRWSADLAWRAAAEAERYGLAFGAFDGRLGSGAAQLAGQLFGPDHPWSASQLADFATCPFRFFAGRVLRLGEIEEAGDELAPRSIGELYHEALRQFFSRHLGEALTDTDLPALHEELAGIVDAVCAEAEADGLLVHELLWPFYRDEMKRRLAYFLDEEIKRQARTDGQLRPVRLEAAFDVPAAALADVGLRLVGRIDRIDQVPDGRFVIYDYKLSQAPSQADARRGLDLQLPLYIEAAAWLLGEEETGRGRGPEAGGEAAVTGSHGPEAAGAGYIVLRRATVTGLFPAAAEDVHGRSRGLSDEDWAGLREQTLAQARSHAEAARAGDFRVAPRLCPSHCAFRAVCRIDQARIGPKQDAAARRLLAEEAET